MKLRSLILPAAFLASAPAAAEVVEASTTGFTTSDKVAVAAPPDDVWAVLIEPARWWNGAHSWSGDAANLALEPWAGGCFCETLPGEGRFPEGSARHMTIVQAAPGRLLRMSGSLGPLQGEALSATLSIALAPAEGGTTIEWTYVVGGHARFPLEQVAPAVDGVMTEQLKRLAAFVEGDSPAGE